MDLTNFYESLRIMWQGMAGIAIVIAAFYLMIIGLTKLMPPEEK